MCMWTTVLCPGLEFMDMIGRMFLDLKPHMLTTFTLTVQVLMLRMMAAPVMLLAPSKNFMADSSCYRPKYKEHNLYLTILCVERDR